MICKGKTMGQARIWALAAALAVVWGMAGAAEPPTQTLQLNIAAQPLGTALNEFGRQSGLQVVFFYADIGEGLTSPPLSGAFTAREALEKLLANTDLRFKYLNERTVAIQAEGTAATLERTTGASAVAEGSGIRLAQAQGTTEGGAAEGEQQPARQDEGAKEEGMQLEEVVVTGTHIRGAAPAGSPLHVYTADDIEKTGLQTTQDFLAKIPQNFGGGTTETTSASAVPGRNQSLNTGLGTGINLRGLGADATLVLINGHRVTQTSAGNFVDVSQIPLSAISRIEILSDGASAIYGSDAVAGVVNILLKDRMEGLEFRVNGGTVTEGAHDTAGAGLTGGYDWGSGGILATYDYQHENPLNREDRPFALQPVGDLLPGLSQNQLLVNSRQALGASVIAFDALYSRRKNSSLLYTLPTDEPNDRRRATTEAYGAGLRADVPLPASTQLTVTTSYSEAIVDDSDAVTFADPSGNFTVGANHTSKLFSFGANVARSLLALRGGDSMATMGGEYRHESFDGAFEFDGAPFPLHVPKRRDVRSAYVEFFAPWIGPQNQMPGVYRLELSAAVRHENYSDAGTTTNPKIGVSWQPVAAWTLRGSYGTSFRAPSFDQEDTSGNVTDLNFIPDPDFTNQTLALTLVGNQPDLRPEKSRTFSFGLDYRAPQRGLTAGIDYFNTRFEGRIAAPSSTPFDILASEAVFAPIITRNPSDAQIAAALAAAPIFVDETNGTADVADVEVIIDNFAQNIGITRVDGIDFSLADSFSWGSANATAALNVAKLLHFSNQVTPVAPEEGILASLYNPPKLRLRGGLTVEQERWSAALFANYTPSYTDDFGTTPVNVADWLTLDLSSSYRLPGELAVTLLVQNVLDERPPHVGFSALAESQFLQPLGYDPANASPLGRFVNLQVRKRFQ
jgi:iron complex outermembrane recepter protein